MPSSVLLRWRWLMRVVSTLIRHSIGLSMYDGHLCGTSRIVASLLIGYAITQSMPAVCHDLGFVRCCFWFPFEARGLSGGVGGERGICQDKSDTANPGLSFCFGDHAPRSSAAVLASWHALQSGCQLDVSQKSFWSPLCGIMWSTTVAPRMHSRLYPAQIGCCAKYVARAFCQRRLYPRSWDDGREASVAC